MTVEGLRSMVVYLQSLTDQWVSIKLMGLKFLGLFTGFSNLDLKFIGLFLGLMFVWRVWFDFSCDVLGLLEIEGWVWVCVLCVLNL